MINFSLYRAQSKEEKYFIHNHLAFTVKYHRDAETDLARIVGFEVKPFRLVLLAFQILLFAMSSSPSCET